MKAAAPGAFLNMVFAKKHYCARQGMALRAWESSLHLMQLLLAIC